MTEKSLTLKEEYMRRKVKEQATAFMEAKQLLESYYLIAEKLDTATISRIVDSMNGVEEALSEFLPKLRSVQAGLDAAEAELIKLVSGKAGNNPNKTSVMLGKAMAFYQHLTAFLRQDLPVLLRSRIFASARTNPDQPVGTKAMPAFQQALEQEKTGGFLKRLFSSSNIPYIDNVQLAKELCTLTYDELERLSKVGKVPAVMPQAQIDQAAAQAVGTTAIPSVPSTSSVPLTGTEAGQIIKAKVARALAPWVKDPQAVAAVMKALL